MPPCGAVQTQACPACGMQRGGLQHGGSTSLRLRVAQQSLEGCSDDLLVVKRERLRGRCHIVPLRLCRIILPAIKQPQSSRARPAFTRGARVSGTLYPLSQTLVAHA